MQVTRDRTERPRGALLQPDIEFWYSLYRIGRSREAGAPASVEALVGYYPGCIDILTLAPYRGGRQCQVGSLTGAVAS